MLTRREYFANRLKIAVVFAPSAILTACAAATLIGMGLRSPDPGENALEDDLQRLLCLTTIAFLSVGMLAMSRLLVSRAPALVIDDEGLVESGRALGLSVGRIRFSEMVAVEALGEDFVAIELADVEAFLREAPLTRRLAVRLNQRTGHPAITIPVNMLRVSSYELAVELRRAKAASTAAPTDPKEA